MFYTIATCAVVTGFLIMALENDRLEKAIKGNCDAYDGMKTRVRELEKEVAELEEELDEAAKQCNDAEEDLAREEEKLRACQQQLEQMTHFKDEIIVTTLAVGVTMLIMGAALSLVVVTRPGFTVN